MADPQQFKKKIRSQHCSKRGIAVTGEQGKEGGQYELQCRTLRDREDRRELYF
jgi:hypothetical protein